MGPKENSSRCHWSISFIRSMENAPDASRQLSDILNRKGIPHNLEIWGHDVNHDWPWWRKMLPYMIDRLGW